MDQPTKSGGAHPSNGIGKFITDHPMAIIGGTLAIGILLFSMGGRGSPQVQNTVTPIAQAKPPPEMLTTDQFNAALARYDEEIKFYINHHLNYGTNPPPYPVPPYKTPPAGEG